MHLDGRCLTRGYGTVQLEPCDGKSDMQTWELTDDGLLRPIVSRCCRPSDGLFSPTLIGTL